MSSLVTCPNGHQWQLADDRETFGAGTPAFVRDITGSGEDQASQHDYDADDDEQLDEGERASGAK